MIKGVDISTLLEMEENNIRYYDFDNEEITDILVFMKEHGIESIRLRLWVDPYSEEGIAYEGGTLSLERVIEIAKKVQNAGFSIMLDYHFSDFWTDPGKQMIPKAWQNYDFAQLKVVLSEYVKTTLQTFSKHEIKLDFIQPGNEITNGMLWPIGKVYEDDVLIDGGYKRLSELLKVAVEQIRDIYPESKIILHLERSGDAAMYDEWFSHMIKEEVDFDIIGLSYYPFFHGSFDLLGKTLDVCNSFGYPTMIVETGYVYTLEPAPNTTMVVLNKDEGFVPYPYTVKGQADFIKRLSELAKEKNVQGIYYWEPLWLPGENVNWSSHAGREYINEKHKSGGNEWSNHALFSYEGKAHEAWKVIKNI
ncbi:MAG: cellulase family glycosylhydrolase [Erysipelotrichaceae bacterium]|nr:cellulase family glycosylhydrolase [Erysipelotrichaceae bacterium]